MISHRVISASRVTPPARIFSHLAPAVATVLVVAACSAPPGAEALDDDTPPAFTGALPSPGAPAPAAAPATTGSTPASAPPTASAGGGEQGPASNVPIAPSTTPPPASNGSNAGSPSAGAGGSSMVPPSDGDVGAGGSSMGEPEAPPAEQPPAEGQPPVTPPPGVQPPPAGPDIECPAGASFCSGFESAQFPAGTQFHSVGPNAPMPFAFDTADAFAGTQSLVIPATNSGGFFYRALAVPVPGQDFWVRLYMNLSSPLGDNSHDSVFGASSGAITADVNGEALVELSEQFNEILLNTDDALFNPETNVTLPANTWLCMEAHYNGATGDVQIFADGDELINAPGYRQVTYQSFRIGYMRYNDDRTIRYDDLIVAPARVGCN